MSDDITWATHLSSRDLKKAHIRSLKKVWKYQKRLNSNPLFYWDSYSESDIHKLYSGHLINLRDTAAELTRRGMPT